MFLSGLLQHAKKGGEDLVRKEEPAQDEPMKKLTTEEEAMAANILSMIQKSQTHDQELAKRHEDRLFESDIPKDINGHENETGEPVYYQPYTTQISVAAGTPYHVSDVDHICKQCTRFRKCKRHRKPHRVKTDISLCKANHLRMAVEWDITDPENRKGTWTFNINEHFDRLDDPERRREEHAFYERKKAEGASDKVQEKGCRPIDPKWRIKELAVRMTEDHNKEMEAKAKVSNLDPMGREYQTRRKDWGLKDPFKPSQHAGNTRAAWEYKTSLDNARIELEIRVLLQAWYKGKLSKEERPVDRTSVNANALWREKMEALEMRAAEKASGERLDESNSSDEETQHAKKMLPSSRRVQMMKKAEKQGRFKTKISDEQRDARLAARETAREETRKAEKAKIAARAKKRREDKKAEEEEEWRQAQAAEKAERKAKRDANKAPTKRKAAFVESSDSETEKSAEKQKVAAESKEAALIPEEELTPEKIAMFEQMAADVEDDASGKKKTDDKPKFQKPKLQAAARDFTAEERKLLQSIKQKQVEVVHSEEEVEPEPEPEIEDDVEQEEEAHEQAPKPKISKRQKAAVVSPPPAPRRKSATKKPTEEKAVPEELESKTGKRKASRCPSPSSSLPVKKNKSEKAPPKPKSSKPRPEPAVPKPKAEKRKRSPSPPSNEAPVKKSRKLKSSATIADSDDEADYELPAAPALELPEQSEGWEFAEPLSEEVAGSVKVMQTDKKKKSNAVEGIVIEQGTTILKRVEGENLPPKAAVEEEDLVEIEKWSLEPIPEAEPAVEKEEYKISPSEAGSEDEHEYLPAPQSSSPSVSSAMKKRRTSVNGKEKPVKKAKKVSFEEDVVDVERKRKMSIEYMVDGGEYLVDENEVDEEPVVQDEATSEDSGAEVEVVEATEDDEDVDEAEEVDEEYDELFE
jgi:hypothetical protein